MALYGPGTEHIGCIHITSGSPIWATRLNQFPREDILNLNIGRAGWRVPCTRVEGLLCACSATPIPKEYPHGARIPVTVRFFGKSGRQLAEAPVIVWADRWDERATKQPAAERQLGEEEDANPPAVVQPFVSGLYAGGELSDSRPAVRLQSKAARGAHSERKSPKAHGAGNAAASTG